MVWGPTVTSVYHSLHGAPVIHPWRSATGYTPEGLDLTTLYSAFNWRDFVGQILTKALIDLGPCPIEPLRRVYLSRGAFDKVVVQGDKPSKTPYDGSLDWKRYGSFLDSAFTTGRVLFGGPPPNFSLEREHNVTHALPSGDFRVRDDCVMLYNHTGDFRSIYFSVGNLALTVSIPVFHEATLSAPVLYRDLAGVNTLSGWEYNIPYTSGTISQVCEIRTLLRHLEVLIADTFLATSTIQDGDAHGVITNDFVWEEIPGVIRVSYLTRWATTWGGGGFVTFKTVITIPTAVPVLPATGYENGNSDGPLHCASMSGTVVRDIVDGTSPHIHAWFNDEYHHVDLIDQSWLYMMSTPGHEDYTGSEHPAEKLLRLKPWRSHKANVQAYASDIRYSAFQSTAAALDTSTQSLQTDIWQTLVKIPGISDQIPDFAEAARLISSLRSGVRLSTLSSIVDFATELRLTHQFEWRPEFDLITELGPKMVDTLKEVARLSASPDNEVVLRGKFEFDFPPGTFGYPHSHLTTHSRVAVESGGFRYLDGLLSLKATGFGPLASTAWDLTPFSFVANWFTGIGPRIRDLESVALVGVMGVKTLTHSYLVESTLALHEVEAYRIDQSGLPGSNPLRWRFFVREVSTHIPPPKVGAFDFRMPTRMPDWATVGSLVWQVFL